MWQAFKNIASPRNSSTYENDAQEITTPLAIGIDLGTTFSCVAVYKNGLPQIIANEHGDNLTPSIVFYDPKNTDVSVGKYADEGGIHEIDNVIYDIKRLMGRKYDDIYVQNLLRNGNCTYKIVRGKNDNIEIEVKQNNKLFKKTPEEVSSEILKYLKNAASEFLGVDVTEAVVSVPAHFGNAQRKATKRAAELAGLTVLKLVCEPVAGAIYYSMDKLKTKTTLLVFDFGGGTLDVSVIEVDKEKFEVKGIEGDSFLGGRDFDQKLFDYFFHAAKNKIFTEGDKRVAEHLLRVKKSCIKIKKKLTLKEEVAFDLDHFGRNEHESIPLTISRKKFEELSEDLFNRAVDLITLCLTDLELTKDDINKVLLVGGTTRIPKLKEMLKSYFGSQKLKTDLNPDHAVALGAAVQAAIWKQDCKELKKYKVIDITPLTLGIELDGGLMEVLIIRHTKLPARSRSVETCTSENNQISSTQDIYEGERKNCKHNVLLATLVVNNIPPGRAGNISFNTIFTLDEDGILTAETSETLTGNKSKIVLTTHWLSQKRIRSTLKEAQMYKEEDDRFEKLIEYRRKIRLYCNYILYDMDKIDVKKRNDVKRNCYDILNFTKSVDKKTIEDLCTRFEAIKQKVDPVIRNKIDINLLDL